MSTAHVDDKGFEALLSEALSLPSSEKLRAACAELVRALPQEAEETRRRAALLAATAVHKLLQSPDGTATTLARSVAAWMRVQESALTGLITTVSALDTADAIQAWSDAYAFASPEEEEEGQGTNSSLSTLRRTVRTHIISCISTWCTSSPRSLFAHLPQLVGTYPPPRGRIASSRGALGGGIGRASSPSKPKLSLLQMGLEDPAPPVRLGAVHCVRDLLLAAQKGKYLQLADETSGRGYAFTSLSAQVAQALTSIRSATAAGVERTVQGPAKLALAYLDVAEVLITKVVKAKLKVPHRPVLAPALNKAVNGAVPVVAVRAWDLLKLLGDEPVQPTVPPEVLDESLASLAEDQDEANEAWPFLTALAGMPIWTQEQQLNLLEHVALASPSAPALRALWGTMQHRWPFALAGFARPALAAIQECLIPSASIESQRVAGQCAATLLLFYQADTKQVVQSVRILTEPSRPPSVRAAVFHTLGAEAQNLISAPSSASTLASERAVQEGWSTSLAYAGEIRSSLLNEPGYLEMAAQMTWAMANMLEGTVPVDLRLLDMVCDWVPLSERVGINAARAVGCLLSQLPSHEPVVGQALATLALAVRTRTPKMRWNVAAAAQRAVHAQGSQLAVHPELQELCRALERNLQEGGNVKVIRACASALCAMPWAHWKDDGSSTLAAVRASRARLLDSPRTGASARVFEEALAELALLEKAVGHV